MVVVTAIKGKGGTLQIKPMPDANTVKLIVLGPKGGIRSILRFNLNELRAGLCRAGLTDTPPRESPCAYDRTKFVEKADPLPAQLKKVDRHGDYM